MNIDFNTFSKSRKGIGNGFDYRTSGVKPITVIVHTTNGNKGTLFSSEAKYIYNSPNVGAHYLVGKQGQVVRFLDPMIHRAWHAGAVNDSRFNNNNSIGIEVHYTPGEGSWTHAMYDALTGLLLHIR